MRQPTDGENGFTLIELLIAMLIMLVITVPLVASFALGIRSTAESGQDVQNSVDAQLLSKFLDVDVAGSDTVATSGGCTGSGGTVVLTLSLSDEGGTSFVTYARVPDPIAQADLGLATPVFKLDRLTCDAATPGGSGSTTVAHQLVQNGATAPVSVLCDGQSTCSSTPTTITFRLQASSRLLTDVGAPGVFTFGVTAARRVSD